MCWLAAPLAAPLVKSCPTGCCKTRGPAQPGGKRASHTMSKARTRPGEQQQRHQLPSGPRMSGTWLRMCASVWSSHSPTRFLEPAQTLSDRQRCDGFVSPLPKHGSVGGRRHADCPSAPLIAKRRRKPRQRHWPGQQAGAEAWSHYRRRLTRQCATYWARLLAPTNPRAARWALPPCDRRLAGSVTHGFKGAPGSGRSCTCGSPHPAGLCSRRERLAGGQTPNRSGELPRLAGGGRGLQAVSADPRSHTGTFQRPPLSPQGRWGTFWSLPALVWDTQACLGWDAT